MLMPSLLLPEILFYFSVFFCFVGVNSILRQEMPVNTAYAKQCCRRGNENYSNDNDKTNNQDGDMY